MAACLRPNQVAVVERLELVLGYVFSDKTLAREAMQRDHKGESFLRGRTLHQNNRRLAVLGDLVIYLVMCQERYASNHALKSWTQIRDRQTTNKFFCNIAKGLKLDSQFLFPRIKKTADTAKRTKMLATLVEAIVAAVWLDSGKSSPVTATILVIMGIMREEQVPSHELGAADDGCRASETFAQESEAAQLGVAFDPSLIEGQKLEEIVAREVASVTTLLTQVIAEGFECQLSKFEQRMNRLKTDSTPESEMEKNGKSKAVTQALKALPGWGIAKALLLGHRIWEAKLVLQAAIHAD